MTSWRCWFSHACQTQHDETGYWGECIRCHKRFGFVTRKEMQAYIDRELADKAVKNG